MVSMSKNKTRRETLKQMAWFSAAMGLDHGLPAQSGKPDTGDAMNGWTPDGASNFKAIYQVPALKAAFLLFLKNVYNLYPEDRFHSLIEQATNSVYPGNAVSAIPAMEDNPGKDKSDRKGCLGGQPSIRGCSPVKKARQ